MTRVLTIDEYLLERLTERARARGEDIELVWEKPKPQLVVNNVVALRTENATQKETN
jgi:hypothetical protein